MTILDNRQYHKRCNSNSQSQNCSIMFGSQLSLSWIRNFVVRIPGAGLLQMFIPGNCGLSQVACWFRYIWQVNTNPFSQNFLMIYHQGLLCAGELGDMFSPDDHCAPVSGGLVLECGMGHLIGQYCKLVSS